MLYLSASYVLKHLFQNFDISLRKFQLQIRNTIITLQSIAIAMDPAPTRAICGLQVE